MPTNLALGLTLSHDGKCHEHIQSISSSASIVLGMIRKLKFSLNRKSLNKIYLSLLRPLFEYASIIWDGCTQYEKDNLERLQHGAARLGTELTRSCSFDNLYKEIGWIALQDRRKYKKNYW